MYYSLALLTSISGTPHSNTLVLALVEMLKIDAAIIEFESPSSTYAIIVLEAAEAIELANSSTAVKMKSRPATPSNAPVNGA